jgi:hypothetical protein
LLIPRGTAPAFNKMVNLRLRQGTGSWPYAVLHFLHRDAHDAHDMANWAYHATDGLEWIAEILLYLLPAIVALSREHHQKIAILVLNVLLGWTAVGWVAALIWALSARAASRMVLPSQRQKRRSPS